MESDGPPSPSRRGLHLSRVADLPYWLGEELYAVEVDGDVVEGRSVVAASRARLTERVTGWHRDAAVAFGRDCVWAARDVVVRLLRTAGRDPAADALEAVPTLTVLAASADDVAQREAASATDDLGYLADAARFAEQIEGEAAWASQAATVALVTATAAARGGGAGSSWAGERARQAAWLSAHVLATC